MNPWNMAYSLGRGLYSGVTANGRSMHAASFYGTATGTDTGKGRNRQTEAVESEPWSWTPTAMVMIMDMVVPPN